MFTLPQLPYQKDDLVPYLSASILDYHYGKHHQGYVNALNNLVVGTDFCTYTNEELPAVIKATYGNLATRSIFNNAGQVWNHNFYWQSIKKNGGITPTGKLLDRINKDFGSIDKFNYAFTESGKSHFGSGWVWLVLILQSKNLKFFVHLMVILLLLNILIHTHY